MSCTPRTKASSGQGRATIYVAPSAASDSFCRTYLYKAVRAAAEHTLTLPTTDGRLSLGRRLAKRSASRQKRVVAGKQRVQGLQALFVTMTYSVMKPSVCC